MSYKIGHCPCCSNKIMVQDSNGAWNTYKPNFRQADIYFSDGSKMRTILCEDCLEEDLGKFMEAILSHDSEACDQNTKKIIRAKGIPLRMELAIRARQGIKLGG